MKSNLRVITFGTFDLFHLGHLLILKRARELGTHLTVGVSSDELNYSKKQKYPIYSTDERLKIIANSKYVDEVFVEESLELKGQYIKQYNADVLVMGHDWEGKFDEYKKYCDVVYLKRTDNISTTEIIQKVKAY